LLKAGSCGRNSSNDRQRKESWLLTNRAIGFVSPRGTELIDTLWQTS
jgi:hypothetical protein